MGRMGHFVDGSGVQFGILSVLVLGADDDIRGENPDDCLVDP